jgi:hypothetical protein
LVPFETRVIGCNVFTQFKIPTYLLVMLVTSSLMRNDVIIVLVVLKFLLII